MAKIKCPFTYPHKSRAAMVGYICGIGGYTRFNEGRWPISFEVGCYLADTSFERLWERLKESGEIPQAEEDRARYYLAASRVYKEHEERWFDWGMEEAREGFLDSDTYYMLWDGSKPMDLTWEFHGRGGKHLVLTEFEGLSLENHSSETLAEELMSQTNGRQTVDDEPKLIKGYEWDISFGLIRKLYKFMRQCEAELTSEKASAETEYSAAFRLGCMAEVKAEELAEEAKSAEELYAHAERVVLYLADHTALEEHTRQEYVDALGSLRMLCAAAGVDHDTLMGPV